MPETLDLTPRQLAARKAVATRVARQDAALEQTVRKVTRDIDAVLLPRMSGTREGWMLKVSLPQATIPIIWFFPNKPSALAYAAPRFNLVEEG